MNTYLCNIGGRFIKLKKLLILTLCLAMLAGISTPALAAQETITVDPISIMVGGKEFLPTDPNGDNALVFVYNGTTYAPLRALAEAYGLTVGYDSEKHLATVEFNANTGIDFYSLLEEVSAERKAKLLSSTVLEGYNDYLVDDPSASNLVTEQEKHSLFTPSGSVKTPVITLGFAGWIILPNGSFGSDIAPLPHGLPVYLDGVQTANFTVTSSDPTGCAVSRSSDGYLLLTATVPGYYGITVRCGETERTFVWFADERYES